MLVLVVPDKFKSTLTAREAAQAIASGWAAQRPGDVVQTLPMSDGGDGFAEVLGELLHAERRPCTTTDAAGRERNASWWFEPTTKTAIIEAAQANGVALLPAGRYHPFQLDTFGVAALLKTAVRCSAKCTYVGIGGSATNDGGFGLARALGWTFWDQQGRELRAWTDLVHLACVRQPVLPQLAAQDLIAAVDVTNPLLGPAGTTRVYGPQKGLRNNELTRAEACLSQLADIITRTLGHDYASEPGSGAAGGLGFGLRVFAGARVQPGAEVFAAQSNLERRIADADVIVTAEGCFDAQSLMGKGVGDLAARCARLGKRCLCLTGLLRVSPQETPWSGFKAFSIVPELTDQEQSQLRAAFWLRQLSARVASSV